MFLCPFIHAAGRSAPPLLAYSLVLQTHNLRLFWLSYFELGLL